MGRRCLCIESESPSEPCTLQLGAKSLGVRGCKGETALGVLLSAGAPFSTMAVLWSPLEHLFF